MHNHADLTKVQILLQCGFRTFIACIILLMEGIIVTGMVLESPIADTAKILHCLVELVSLLKMTNYT